MSKKKLEPEPQPRLGRADWIAAARSALIAGGIESVRVDRLAKQLNVSRGGFYWHFKDRSDLLQALLKHWEREAVDTFETALTGEHADGIAKLRTLLNVWIDEVVYSPRYDSAMRDWARISRKVARAVRQVDNRRIEIIQGIFDELGFSEDEAFIRSRITYFHQVGYYTLGLAESQAERKKLQPLYIKSLTSKQC